MTLPLVPGGPDPSRNGFSNVMPLTVMLRSATGSSAGKGTPYHRAANASICLRGRGVLPSTTYALRRLRRHHDPLALAHDHATRPLHRHREQRRPVDVQLRGDRHDDLAARGHVEHAAVDGERLVAVLVEDPQLVLPARRVVG